MEAGVSTSRNRYIAKKIGRAGAARTGLRQAQRPLLFELEGPSGGPILDGREWEYTIGSYLYLSSIPNGPNIPNGPHIPNRYYNDNPTKHLNRRTHRHPSPNAKNQTRRTAPNFQDCGYVFKTITNNLGMEAGVSSRNRYIAKKIGSSSRAPVEGQSSTAEQRRGHVLNVIQT